MKARIVTSPLEISSTLALRAMSKAVSAAIFAAGAAIGAGATAIITSRRHTAPAPVPVPVSVPNPLLASAKAPFATPVAEGLGQRAIVQVEPLGNQVVINPQLALSSEVLKYGNPGKSRCGALVFHRGNACSLTL